MVQTRNISNVVHWGFGFFLVFASFCTVQNIVAAAYDQNGYGSLGFYTIGMIYVFFAAGSLLCPSLIEQLGAIKSMTWGSFWYFVWVISCLLPVIFINEYPTNVIIWVVMLTTGSINGIGASMIWVGQGKYISTWWIESNKGLFFGLVWAIFAFSFIIGNLLGNHWKLTL